MSAKLRQFVRAQPDGRKQHVYALGTLLLLNPIIFAKLVFLRGDGAPYLILQWDFAAQYCPWLIYIGDSFRAGIMPRWVPYVAGGTPFFINPQTQLYSPLTLFIATLFGYSQRTAQLQSVFMLFLGGVGAYLLSYALWRNRWSALVTGMCFNFTSAVFTNLEHMTIINSVTLLPWLFWATTMAARPLKRWSFPTLAFLVYFFITSGYPGVIAMAMLWLLPYTLYLLYFSPEQRRTKLRLSVRYGLAWLLGLGLSAAHWLPIVIHRKEFTRGTPLTTELALTGGNLLFKHLWGMLFSFMPTAPLPGTDVDISMRGLYFGALALPLAIAAVLYIKERIVPALLLTATLAFLMACGSMFFGRVALHILFPLLNFSRFPAADSRTLMVLALVVLAGGGIRLLADKHERGRIFLGRACGALLVIMSIGLLVLRGVFDKATYDTTVVNFLSAELLFVALALLVLRAFTGRALLLSMIALLALELGTCVLANEGVMGRVIPGEQQRQYLATRRRGFTPEAANVPRLTVKPDLVNEEAGRGYVEKTFYLSDYNPLRLRRYQYLLDAGFTDWLTNGPRVVALPPGSQPLTYETFQPLVSPVDYRILTYQPNQVSYQVRADRDSLLVFNEIFFPGWRATVDGQRTAVRPVSGGLRGVQVAAGTHTVGLSFQPSSFYVGVAVSLVSAALFLLWCGLIFYATRRANKIKREPTNDGDLIHAPAQAPGR